MPLDIAPHEIPCAVCGTTYDSDFFNDEEEPSIEKMNGRGQEKVGPRKLFLFGYGCPECGWPASDEEKAKIIYADNDELVEAHYQAMKRNKLTVVGEGERSPARLFSAYTYEFQYDVPPKVIDREWDNLVILDAARYDIFEEHSILDGDLSRRFTRSSHSHNFADYNFFSEESLHDTLCVTSNIWYSAFDRDDPFFMQEDVISPAVVDKNDYAKESQKHNFPLDLEEHTKAVLPRALTDRTLNLHKKYPNKKMVVHYMQPHTPHISLTDMYGNEQERFQSPGASEWELVKRGELSREQILDAYKKNLRLVEESVQNLLEGLDGKTVVTADHGENLGDWAYGETHYGHQTHTDHTRFVPWLEIEGDRREVHESEPVSTEDVDNELVKDNLRMLGYIE